MGDRLTGPICLLLLAFVSAASPGAGIAEEAPSLEFTPSQEVIPEPRVRPRSQPMTLFTTTVGGFGISRGSFDKPVDVAVDSRGDYYVLDAGNQRVQKFSSNDWFDLEWGSSGFREGRFNDPRAIAVDSEDFVFVVDRGNHRVQKFDSSGNFVDAVGSLGSTTGKFNGPEDIAFDGDGNIYILDSGNDRIQMFDAGLAFREEWGRFSGGREGEFSRIVSMAWSDDRFGYLYLLGEGSCLIQVLSLKGGRSEVEDSWSAISPEGKECAPTRLEIDNEEDYVYILDHANSVLNRYHKDGRYVDSVWEADEPFLEPMGFAVNADSSEVWIADTGNNVIQRFTLR